MKNCLATIERISAELAVFWSKSHGWAPKEAADLLSKSRLDWLDSFNRTLQARVDEVEARPDEPAVLILAWAHLRTLVEGHLKLFLSVFLYDYLKDQHAPKKNGVTKCPDAMRYEDIRQFLIRRGLLVSHHEFINTVQQRGNAIHAFADRPIGTAQEYLEYVAQYKLFLEDIEGALPSPYRH